MMKNINNILNPEFEVRDLEDLHWLLGIQIKFTNRNIKLLQMG
jgi:hypothetical protein